MRIQLYLGLMIALSSTTLAQPATRSLYSFQAAPVTPATDLSAAYSGLGLTLADCTDRLDRLGTLLRERGFGARRNASFDEGATVTRWYDPGTDSTVVAWMSPSGAQHDLEIGVYPWNMRWNELLISY
jgi:hypothetical protein